MAWKLQDGFLESWTPAHTLFDADGAEAEALTMGYPCFRVVDYFDPTELFPNSKYWSILV